MKRNLSSIMILICACMVLNAPLHAQEEPCDEYQLKVVSTNPQAGTVVILQQPACDNNNTAIVEAVANNGYRFAKWTDGYTDNPRTLQLTRDWRLIATWEEIPCIDYQLTAITTYATAGSVQIIQQPACDNDNTAIVEAYPNEGYYFAGWTDGNTDNPRTLQLTHDQSIFATWEKIPCDTFQLQVKSNNTKLGEVTILQQPTCENKNAAVITATPAQGCHFTEWSDHNTQSTRVLQLTQDTSLIAVFDNTIYYIIVQANHSDYGDVIGTGTYIYGMEVTLTAHAKPGYKFDKWNDGNTDNPRTITVTSDAYYTALFTEQYHFIRALSNNTDMGTTTGTGKYQDNTYATLTATPNQGFIFTGWDDGNKETNRQILVVSDATYTAYFAPNTAIDNTLTQKITVNQLTLHFDINTQQQLTITSATGQTIYCGDIKPTIQLPAHGIYIIRIGEQTAQIML